MEAWLQLDLKLIADVGIVGYPNAGKSTLLSRVTKARPKIADYPFTTLEPILGVVDMGERSFVMADIPGIIEGAHLGRGLGLGFLRDIERTKVLIHLVHGSSEDPLSDLGQVEAELGSYESPLNDRPRVVVITKIDLPEVRSRLPQLEKEFKGLGIPVYYISPATGEGVRELLLRAVELVAQSGTKEIKKKEEEEEEFRTRQPRRGGCKQ